MRYHNLMIKSFKHKGLQKFYDSGKVTGIQAVHKKRLRLQLIAIDTASNIDDMNIPGFNLHGLKGKRKGVWSIKVNGNWRITFKFVDGDAYILDYEDYH